MSQSWLFAFILTLGVELPIMLAALPEASGSLPRRLFTAVLANGVSHPLLWYGILPAGAALGWTWSQTVCLGEFWAVGSEGLVLSLALRGLPWRRSLGISALANGASFALGLGIAAGFRLA